MTEDDFDGKTVYDTLESSVGSPSHKRQVGGDHYMNMGLQPWKAMKADV